MLIKMIKLMSKHSILYSASPVSDRAFEVAGPRTWNSLPETIRETKTLPAFKKTVETVLDR